jgi:ATPase subunit of ABC transporter with duplicated ATPase domains
VAELEVEFAELDGYSAESKAGELLLGLDIPESYHTGLMSALPPALKLRVLLAQVLFSKPNIFLLDEPTNNLDINTIRWLESVLNQSKATMVIISHDRHFLNSVCTHIADLDYGDLKLYPGNYDQFTMASMQKRTQMMADNEKKQTQIEQLQAFVRRFSANASKAKQATSRAKQLDKIQLDDMRPSSRKSPYIKFEQEKQLYRNALVVRHLTKGYGDAPLFNDVKFTIMAGEKVAIIGDTGIGKTTMLKCLVGELPSDNDETTIKFAEQASYGYFAQDHSAEFDSTEAMFDYLYRFKKPEHDEQMVRGALGRMLFSGEDITKPVNKLSGGEKVRLLLAKFTLEKPNVLLLDEPTNHLDMESIEALNTGLEQYPGTVIFVSHDREFVSSIASRIIEITADDVKDFNGNYEDYLLKMAV